MKASVISYLVEDFDGEVTLFKTSQAAWGFFMASWLACRLWVSTQHKRTLLGGLKEDYPSPNPVKKTPGNVLDLEYKMLRAAMLLALLNPKLDWEIKR